MQRALGGLALGTLIGTVLVALPYVITPGLIFHFSNDSPFRPRYARGFYPAEQTADGLTFAWTSGRALMQLRSVPRGTAWLFEARVNAPRPQPGESDVVLLVDRKEISSWRLARGSFHDLRAIVPAATSESTMQIELRVSDVFVPGAEDPRELGLMVDRIALVPESRLRGLPFAALARTAASLGVIAALAAVIGGLVMAAGTAIPSAIAVSALAFHHSALYLDFDRTAVWSVGPASLVFALGFLLRRGLGVTATTWGAAAIALGTAAVFVKLLVVLHPGLTLGDSVFHLNRLQLVLNGTWLFTSTAPGGHFPYPVAFYVIVSKLFPPATDWIAAMRGVVVTVEGIAAMYLALLVARERDARAGLFTLATWHALPALFQVHGIAYLTNAFGNLAAAAALSALVAVKPGRWILPALVAGVCAIVAFLSHVSSFVILAVTLLLVPLMAVRSRRATLGVAALAICLLAGAVAWTTYYRHFMPVYAELRNRSADARPDQPVPVQRAEAHQTVWVPGGIPLRNRASAVPGYVAKYFGWPALMLAAAGLMRILRRSRTERDDLDVVLAAWVSTSALFLLVSLFTPLDLRYYLAAAPAVATLCGCSIARCLTPAAPRMRLIALCLFALVVGQGVWYVVRFFGTVLPR